MSAGRTADTRAAECAAWPVRSRSRAPHRRWPAAPRRRGYSVAGSGAADSGRAGALPQVAPQQAARLAALFLVLLLAQNLLHPAVNLLAIFAFEPDAFAGF